MRSQLLFSDQIEMVRNNIYKNELDLAIQNLDLCLASRAAEQRWKDHFHAIVLMRKGKIEEAIGRLVDVLQEVVDRLRRLRGVEFDHDVAGRRGELDLLRLRTEAAKHREREHGSAKQAGETLVHRDSLWTGEQVIGSD